MLGAFYKLDLTIFLGYRVRTRIATGFRIWTMERLHEFLDEGFAMGDRACKNLGVGSYGNERLDGCGLTRAFFEVDASDQILVHEVRHNWYDAKQPIPAVR